MRWGWRAMTGGGFLGLVLALGLGSVLPRRWDLPRTTTCSIPVYLQTGAIHTDIILPRQNQYVDWNLLLHPLKIGAENAQYLSFGFGEQGFYMGQPGSLLWRWPDGLRALFWINPSIVFVNPVRDTPPNARCIGLTSLQYRELTDYIKTSFRRSAQGQLIPLGQGYQPTGQFFQGEQWYSILFTCNHWTAQGLNQANVPTPLVPLFSQSILWHSQNACPCPAP